MQNKDKLFNTDSLVKEFSFKGKKFAERVARYPKILYTDILHLNGANYQPLYPQGKENVFSLRIDADEIEEDDFKQYLNLLKPFAECVTIFCPAYAFIGKEYLLREAKNMGFDIQSHGFYHHTYRNYENNYHNLLKAKDFFNNIGINTIGFAAPMGRYNINLMRALENLGYRYSSEFSFDYLNFPHYPKLGQKFSKVLQIPIFPICPELLFMNSFTADEIIEYYDKVIAQLKDVNIPIIIYSHTGIRYKQTKDCLKQLLEKTKDDDRLYKCNMSNFASWCFSLQDKAVEKYGIVSPLFISGSLKLPSQELLGIPKKLSLTIRFKGFIKEKIDFEIVTPAHELKGNTLSKGIKLLLRRLRGAKARRTYG